jgi:hypothetical protein
MLGSHRLIEPILAMFALDGHHHATTVPIGTVVDLNGKKFNGDRLMEVQWDGRMVLMFTADLKAGTIPA